ncbi:hypothetical protein DS745_12080 [Anaerobacillus alkaliphilus]|uniref:Uncharacterized protein n=1 Tax=Anaerobacillus alkaliphilus TaxID=1548597 RepID=A0A4Q0VTG9_9BACI|nr:hypothetical protein [Anaerobacillus alkaliphilus]RXJ00265.1 hypothetical protein DS745_12080 [Anaerobacillus alkaliphilus]
MRPQIILGIAIVFFLFVPLGGFANIFPLFVIGLIVSGIGFILYAIFVREREDQYKWVYWLHRSVVFGIGCLAFVAGTYNSLDLPAYFKKEYDTIQGIPTEIIYYEPSRGEITGTFSITIDGEIFSIDRRLGQGVEDLENRMFTIRYLPRSKWIIDYEMK